MPSHKMKDDVYQVLLDGLKWRREALDCSRNRTQEIYVAVINRAPGHQWHTSNSATRGVFLLIVGIVLAHAVVFFDCLCRLCLRRPGL